MPDPLDRSRDAVPRVPGARAVKGLGVPDSIVELSARTKAFEESTRNVPDDSWGRAFKARARRYFGLREDDQ